jgi:hypothetical protein
MGQKQKAMHAMGTHMEYESMASVDNMDRDILDRDMYAVIGTIDFGKRRYGKHVKTSQQGSGQAMCRFSAIIDMRITIYQRL